MENVRVEQEPLRRFLLALCCGDASWADDLAQDALLRAYVASGSFLGLSKFRTWLFRIAYNCYVDDLRKRKGKGGQEVGLEDPSARTLPSSSEADGSFRYQQLYMALEKLPEKERACISMHYFEDLPLRDIASVLQMPLGTVKYNLSVGRTHLKEYLTL